MRRGLAVLFALLGATVLARAAQGEAPWVVGPVTAALLAPPDVQSELARDARLGFPANAAESAAKLLDREPPADAATRGAALLTIGLSGARTERWRLEAAAFAGPPMERVGAILGLGAIGGYQARLRELTADPDARVVGAARAALEGSGGDAAGAAAVRAIRWEAARRFGTVDGRSFPALMAAELVADADFREDVLLPLAASLRRFGVRDHLVELLLTRGRPVEVEAALAAMPAELSRLVVSGIWKPAGEAGWAELVAAVGAARVEASALDILRLGLAQPAARDAAAAALLRAGVRDAFELLQGTTGDIAARRTLLARALGGSGDDSWIGTLSGLALDADPSVRAAAIVAQARLGHAPANDRLRELARDAGRPERAPVIGELARAWSDGFATVWLEEFQAKSAGADRLRIAAGLVRAGRQAPRTDLREALVSDGRAQLPRELVLDMTEALALEPDPRDAEVARALYPDPRDRELDLALARILVRTQDPLGIALVRESLWGEPWNLSCLSAALILEFFGTHGLASQLDMPPDRVTSAARRRVGFALGYWGGLAEVERLARSRRINDPVVEGAYLGALAARTH